MKSTLAVLLLGAIAATAFAIKPIADTVPAAPTAAACATCEQGCTCEKDCCTQTQTAVSADPAATAVSVSCSTTATAGCGENCAGCSECPCSDQAAAAITATQWIATTAEFAAIASDAAPAAACDVAAGQCAQACAAGCSGVCCADNAQAGINPYRIRAPDVLSIRIPIEISQVVQPNGCITIAGLGEVCVNNMTTEEVRLAITKKISEAQSEESRTVFPVFVNVDKVNSKQAYIVLENGQSDLVQRVPATGDTTVCSALCESAWPNPIDFASARIWISRRGSAGEETLLPVAWDPTTSQPTNETNHTLLPSDRLFVKVCSDQPSATSSPVAVAILPPPPMPGIQPPVPQIFSQPFPVIGIQGPEGATEFRFSAIPVAAPAAIVPRPLSPPSPPLIATPDWITATPLQQQPTFLPLPRAEAPQSQRAHRIAELARKATPNENASQIRYRIEVIEDTTGCLAEYEQFQKGERMMFADSRTLLPALRAMQKHDLIQQIASPQLTCVAGEKAQFEIGNETPAENPQSWNGVRVAVAGEELPNGIKVDLAVHAKQEHVQCKVQTELVVACGQTVVLQPPMSAPQNLSKASHILKPFDGVLIRVPNSIGNGPISDAFVLDSDGILDLGPMYGHVRLAGLTIDQAQDAVRKLLTATIEDPEVSVSLAFSPNREREIQRAVYIVLTPELVK